MEKTFKEIKTLKPGKYVLIDNIVCKVDNVQISKPGKHGGAKARLTASGVFDPSVKKTVVKPADTKIDVPIILKKTAQVIAVIGDNVQLMDLDDYSMMEIPIPDEFKGKLESGKEVVIWKFGANVMIKALK
jgi:translation initiation factor 5A